MESDDTERVSLAQLPESWDDRRLLKHEPLVTVLCCKDQTDNTFDFTNVHWARLAKEGINNDRREFVSAYIRWCLLAFQPLRDEEGSHLPTTSDFAEKSSFWEIFVEIFSILHQITDVSTQRKQKEQQALRVLDRERLRHGFKDFLTLGGVQRSQVPSLVDGRIYEAASEPGSCPATSHEMKESSRNLSYDVTPASRLFSLRAKEIEDATERFMKTLCTDPVNFEISTHSRRTRKAAPSREHLADLARKDKEAEKTLLASAKKKRRGKPKGKGPGKGKTLGCVEVRGETPALEGYLQDMGGTVQVAPGTEASWIADTIQVRFDAESIVVRNAPSWHTLSIGEGADSNPSNLPQKEGKTRKSKKRRAETTEPINASLAIPVPETSKKKRKASNAKRKCESTPESSHQTKEFPASNTVTTSKRGKKISKSKTTIPEYLPVSKRKRGDKFQLLGGFSRPTEIDSNIWPSSDDTRVGEDGSESCISPGFCDIIVEDRIRRGKVLKALEDSRPRPYYPKPPLPTWARPRIWAGSRQALCECTTWFRCYHGGVYFSNGKVHGYLLGGYSAQRDMYRHDGKLIISHGGGKSLEGSAGQREGDASVRALLYNYEKGHPLVLLIDDKYAPFPFDLGEKMYVVLGLYWIVAAWPELEAADMDGKFSFRVKYKFAFQYCEGQDPPWWSSRLSIAQEATGGADNISSSSDTLDDLNGIPHSIGTSDDAYQLAVNSPCPENCLPGGIRVNDEKRVIDCPVCRKESPQIYQQRWICLNPGCQEFFRIFSEEVFSPLKFKEYFLELRRDPGFGKIDLSLSSPLPPREQVSADTLYSTAGWWCSECGQLCPRERWECWECPRCNKSFPLDIAFPIRGLEDFSGQETDLKDFSIYKVYDGITASSRSWSSPKDGHAGMHYTFELPDDRGQIHLIRGNTKANGRANELFRRYQEDALERKFLRRYPLRFHHARGRMLTNYFSHNAGVPYKYAVTTNITDTFDQAPPCVNQALQLIKDRVSLVVKEEADFNEILTAAYMENQKMSYHTDDEKGLGPVVASLSLGSIAHMHFRNRRTSTNRNIDKQLSIVLRHGDVLAMEGALIQKLYEHSVVPLNFRIAATARCIDQGPRIPDTIPFPAMGDHYTNYQP